MAVIKIEGEVGVSKDMDQPWDSVNKHINLYRWKPGVNYLIDLDEMMKKNKKNASRVFKPKSDPKTPFQALRQLLSISITDWNSILCYKNLARLIGIESGKIVCPVQLAKLMMIEAERRGVIVTLDDLYQNVIPHNNSESYTKDSGVKPIKQKQDSDE